MTEPDTRRARAAALNLHGLLAHWNEVASEAWVTPLLGWEEQERARRGLERRARSAHIGRFKPLCDFNWSWPKRCDRAAVDALMTLEFLNDATNVVLVGPNGVGKSTIAQNIAHQALIEGHTVLFTSAGQLLGDLSALDSDSALRRRLRHYARPTLLAIDEVGYLSYSNRHADLMFELISRRYQNKSTLVTVLHGPSLRLADGAWSAQDSPIQFLEARRAVQTPRRASSLHSEASLSSSRIGGNTMSALRRRGESGRSGSTDEAIAAWRAEPRTPVWGQPYYSALAITTALTLRTLFHLALRQTEGLIGSIIALLGLALTVPDHSTMCRRSKTLVLPPLRRTNAGPLHLLVDSTGLKLGGAGEWLVEKHGTSRRRSWRKLHIGIDAGSGAIVAIELTNKDVDDAALTGALLDQVSDPIVSFTADGAYDQDRVHEAVAERHPDAAVIVPPRSSATQRASAEPAPTRRDQHISSR